MATENGSDSVACEQQSNSQLQNGTAGNNEQQNGQQQQQQQQGSMWKSFLVRMFIFWMISNLFRGRQQNSNVNTVASSNLFKTDQKIVSWILVRRPLELLKLLVLSILFLKLHKRSDDIYVLWLRSWRNRRTNFVFDEAKFFTWVAKRKVLDFICEHALFTEHNVSPKKKNPCSLIIAAKNHRGVDTIFFL